MPCRNTPHFQDLFCDCRDKKRELAFNLSHRDYCNGVNNGVRIGVDFDVRVFRLGDDSESLARCIPEEHMRQIFQQLIVLSTQLAASVACSERGTLYVMGKNTVT